MVKICMHVLVSCKNEEVPIKSEGTRVVTTFLPLKVYGDFFQLLKGSLSAVHGWIWQNFELIRNFMIVRFTCINEEDPIKNESARV